MEVMESVLADAPWSVSKVQTIDKCLHSFWLKYRQKIKEEEGGSAARVGTCVHSVLEYGLRTDMPDEARVLSDTESDENAPPTIVEVPSHTEVQMDERLPYLLNLFAKAKRNKLNDEEIADAAAMLPRVKTFCLSMQQVAEKRGVTKFYLEHRAAIGTDFLPRPYAGGGALIRGLMDFGFMTDKNVYVIIDHKTGKPKNLSDYEDQLRIYMLFVMAHHPDAQAVQCGINHTLRAKVDWGDLYTRAHVETRFQPWLDHYLNRLGIKLLSLTDKGGKPKVGPLCSWCGFLPPDLDKATLCPEGVAEVRRKPYGPRLKVVQ